MDLENSPRGATSAESQQRDSSLRFRGRGDDRILYDLWNALLRRRRTFFAVWLAVIVAALAYAILIPPRYEFRTGIDLGQLYVGEDARVRYRPLISADAAATDIHDVVGPMVYRQLAAEQRSLGMRVHAREQTNSLLLTTVAPESAAPAVASLHEALGTALAERLRPTFERELAVVVKQLQVQADALLNEIRADEEQYALLQKRNYNGLSEPAVVALIDSRLWSDLRRTLAEKKGTLASLRARIDSIERTSQPAHIRFTATRSQQAVSPSPAAVLVLAALLGIGLGVMAALTHEFIATAKRGSTPRK